MIKNLTCIECPMGCSIEVELENGVVTKVTGNSCPRGKMYAENEVVCPRRVLTTTIRLKNGNMMPVKTSKPIKKSEMFEIIEKIRKVKADAPIKVGDVIVKNITEDIDLLATDNSN